MGSDFKQGVEFSHWLIKQQISPGDYAIDATVGQGQDTLFLAKLVGKSGKVWGFDIQQQALEQARANLVQANVKEQVTLIQDGHQQMLDYVEEQVTAIMFNLGYLPGSDKNIITHPETTVQAVKAGLELLKVGGLITLVVYLGHSGGPEEKESLIDYVTDLDEQIYNVLQYRFLNQEKNPPEVIAIRKRANF